MHHILSTWRYWFRTSLCLGPLEPAGRLGMVQIAGRASRYVVSIISEVVIVIGRVTFSPRWLGLDNLEITIKHLRVTK